MFHRNALAKHCLNNFSLRRDLEMIVVFPEKLYTTKYIISLVGCPENTKSLKSHAPQG